MTTLAATVPVTLAVAVPPPGEERPPIQQARLADKMGIYLESNDSDGVPRWKVLTALRAYGLNLDRAERSMEPPVRALEITSAALEETPVAARMPAPLPEGTTMTDQDAG